MTDDEIAQKIAQDIDAAMFAAIAGPPRKQRQTALRHRHGRFETVEIGDDGKIIEPPPRCCSGIVIHAPNCKMWGIAS